MSARGNSSSYLSKYWLWSETPEIAQKLSKIKPVVATLETCVKALPSLKDYRQRCALGTLYNMLKGTARFFGS